MYAEDIDLCWRARKRGLKTWFVATAEFVHLGGASSDRRWVTRERSARIGQAEAEMIRDHLSPARAALTIGLMRSGLAARVAYFSVVRNPSAAASCRGSLEGLGRKGPGPSGSPPHELEIEVVQPGAAASQS
jgi:hypothetical protein